MDYHQKTTSLKNVPFSRDAIFQVSTIGDGTNRKNNLVASKTLRVFPSTKQFFDGRPSVYHLLFLAPHSAANLLEIAAIQQKRFAKLLYTRLMPRLYNMLR